jgi:hypothetical protein
VIERDEYAQGSTDDLWTPNRHRAKSTLNYLGTPHFLDFDILSSIQPASLMVGQSSKSISPSSKLSSTSVQPEPVTNSDSEVIDTQHPNSNHEYRPTSRPVYDTSKQPFKDYPAKKDQYGFLKLVSRGLVKVLRNDIGPPVPPKDYHHTSSLQSALAAQSISRKARETMAENSFHSPQDIQNIFFSQARTESSNEQLDHLTSDVLTSTIALPVSTSHTTSTLSAKHSLGSKTSFRNLVA